MIEAEGDEHTLPVPLMQEVTNGTREEATAI